MNKAPAFSLLDQHEKTHSLEDYKNRWVVLYFYPKDDTPGCTKEACAFRDGRDVLSSFGADVIGISKDTAKKHKKFTEKYDLNFTLLADPTAETIKAYGAWGKKKFMGREFEGILRNTYLINPEGEIVKTYEGVDPASHFGDVLNDLRELQA